MANGEWRMADGGWRMANSQLTYQPLGGRLRKISLDQCAFIALQGGQNQMQIKNLCADNNTLIYLQDVNLSEALRSGAFSTESILKSLEPFKSRVRMAPTHTQIMEREVGRGKAVSRNFIHRFNESHAATELIQDVVSGNILPQDVLSDPQALTELERTLHQFERVMIHKYESLSDAIDYHDERGGLGRQDRVRYKFKKTDSINDDVLDMVIKLSLGGVREDTMRWKGDVRKFNGLIGLRSYHLVHGMCGWIRVCQQIQKGNMDSWITSGSRKIVNEYFDTIHTSFVPYYDEVLTFDGDSLKTQQYLKRALQIYDANNDKYRQYALLLEHRDWYARIK
jgi:hypothetical protein